MFPINWDKAFTMISVLLTDHSVFISPTALIPIEVVITL